MVRRVTPSQFRSLVRQAQQKTKQAIDKHNREVRVFNRKAKQAVDTYNREVRAHNARVRSDRQRLKNEIAKLARQSTTGTRLVTLRTSVGTVHTSYERLDRAYEQGAIDDRYAELLDLSEREAANSAGVMNALLGDAPAADAAPDAPESPLTPILTAISADLGDRWKGALFSLNPRNPDAARHFCTSAREVITRILDVKAPDAIVIAAMPDCERTPQRGTPTRRAKIRYFLHRQGMTRDELADFVEDDMRNVVELFEVFNEGTHGTAGAFDLAQLSAVRKRVEDGILYLHRITQAVT